MTNKIQSLYDPSNDIAANLRGEVVNVTWAEYDLAEEVARLAQRIEYLESELARVANVASAAASGESLE